MPKQKSGAQISVADGAGGLRPVTDLRFAANNWPIEFVIPAAVAETWMAHLTAETEERGWSASAFSQLEATENSGTLTVYTATGASPHTLDIVWEKLRNKDLKVRARPSDELAFPLDLARGFLQCVDARQREGRTLRAHRQGLLTYEGWPWHGELWLDVNHQRSTPARPFLDSFRG